MASKQPPVSFFLVLGEVGLSLNPRQHRHQSYDPRTGELFDVLDIRYLRQIAVMPDKLCPHEAEQWKLAPCGDAEMSSALGKASCAYLDHSSEELTRIFKVPGYFMYSLERVPTLASLLHDCCLLEIRIQRKTNGWYLVGAASPAGPLWLSDDQLSFPRSIQPHLPLVKDIKQTFWRYSGRDGSVGQWVLSSAEPEDIKLGFNRWSQPFLEALPMAHVSAAETEQQQCAAEYRSMTSKSNWVVNTPQPAHHNARQQSVWEHHVTALRVLRRAGRHATGTLSGVLHAELCAIQARPTATAPHVRVFAANEARSATSLSGLDFVVRGDLHGKPLIEVHLTPENDAGTKPASKPRPCAVVSPYNPNVVEIQYSPLTDTVVRTGRLSSVRPVTTLQMRSPSLTGQRDTVANCLESLRLSLLGTSKEAARFCHNVRSPWCYGSSKAWRVQSLSAVRAALERILNTRPATPQCSCRQYWSQPYPAA